MSHPFGVWLRRLVPDRWHSSLGVPYPVWVKARSELARAMFFEQHFDEAVRLLRKYGERDPYEGFPYEEVAEFLERLSQADRRLPR